MNSFEDLCMTAAQKTRFELLLAAFNHREDLRSAGAPIGDRLDAAMQLDRARIDVRASL